MNIMGNPPPTGVPVGELRVGNKYRIGKKIGKGSFGDIYQGL
jgi:hypothetical protein